MPVRRVSADSDAREIAEQLASTHPSMLGPHIVAQEQLQRLAQRLIEQKRLERLQEDRRREQKVREELLAEGSDEEEAEPPAAAAPPAQLANRSVPPSCAAGGVSSGAGAAPSFPARGARRALDLGTGSPDALDALDSLNSLEPLGRARQPAGSAALAPLRPASCGLPAASTGDGAASGGTGGAVGGAISCRGGAAVERGRLGESANGAKEGANPDRTVGIAPLEGADRGAALVIDYERDLNKVDDEELAQTKAVMSVEFEAHQLKPGDEGFVYDKRVEFEGACLGVEPWSRTQWSVPQLLR